MKIEKTKMTMVKGDTEVITVVCENYQFQEGDKVEMTVRKTPTDEKRAIYKCVEKFTPEGKAQIRIEPEDTKDLRAGEYRYDVQLTFMNGVVKTIIPCAPFFIGQEVTYGSY